MNNSPEKIFGFEYEVGGSRFVLDLVAETPDQAMQRVKAIAGASFIGEMVPSAANAASDPTAKPTQTA